MNNRKDEIRYISDDLIEFGEYEYEGGCYAIHVHQRDGEIYSSIISYDTNGNENDSYIEDCFEYVEEAKKNMGEIKK